jgi:hypothetical protein
VRPLLGFTWGFDIDSEGVLTVKPTKPLSPGEWQQHVPYLTGRFPAWRFAPMASADATA